MIFSFAGFIFLLQPAFMHGAKNPKSTANSCFEAGMLYGALSAGCYVLYKREKIHSGDRGFIAETAARRNSYYEMDDSDEELPLAQHMSPMERHYTGSPTEHTRSV
ncbi:hypothetical protein PybrP1_009443 [[Pythium] brassicae (nom. inval.)]|nr:hypothetical protein PybrP1_009443 [[Pythium] brassicae (nom. inval.)]